MALISGVLSQPTTPIVGKLSIRPPVKPYEGEYYVVPSAYEDQTLQTAGRVLSENIVIAKVPFFQTSNSQGGITAYIAQEVN